MARFMADYYTILGVGRTASTAEIEAAYRQLAQELDPAALPQTVSARVRELAEAEFQALQQAQRILANPVTRTAYTRHLDEVAEALPAQDAVDREPLPAVIAQDLPAKEALAIHTETTALAADRSNAELSFTDVHRSRQDLWDLDAAPLESVSPWLMRLGVAVILTAGILLSLQWLRPSHTEVAHQEPLPLDLEPAQMTEVPTQAPPAQLPTTGEITRFAAAAIAMRPLVSETDAALAAAAADAQAAILLDFEIAAAAIVSEHSLSLEDYHAIAQQVRETPALQLQVAQLANRLLSTTPQ
ncbi:MAG: DnaJ domain-containing protein [Synechococcaceae cyanobacterium SM2_3_60]|nr:DnaJ domain-containing protein [Synechococcaceae cyanobacterium SM2_3_60]